MEVLVAPTTVLGLVFLVLAILTIFEFLAIGFRVGDIKKQVREMRKESEQQNRHLAAISANLVTLINLSTPGPDDRRRMP
jgi:uncharacterized membrane protein